MLGSVTLAAASIIRARIQAILIASIVCVQTVSIITVVS